MNNRAQYRPEDDEDTRVFSSTEVAAATRSSESQLLRLWRKGCRQAGERLLEDHRPGLHRYFLSRSRRDADDLVQQTCLRCTTVVCRDDAPINFGRFVYGVARNILREQQRSQRSHPQETLAAEPTGSGETETPTQRISHEEIRRKVLAHVNRLPPEFRVALILHYWNGLSVAEIASIQDVAEGTVKSRLGRGRTLLKKWLGSPREGERPLGP